MRYIYQFSISIYLLAINIASLFNPKAKLWVSGRKNIFNKLKKSLVKNENIYWFHCASLGEFEQGKPLMEEIKKVNKSVKILVTFFSPSGYENRKRHPIIDYCFYLPIDSSKNAKKFITIAKPKKAFFVKYEFWYNYLNQLKNNNIPTYLIAGVFRKDQLFFQWYGIWFRKLLFSFNHIFVQNEPSSNLLTNYGIGNVTITGDTRYDTVYNNSRNHQPNQIIATFTKDHTTIIAGSCWEKEEELLAKHIASCKQSFKYIFAPHDVSKKHVEHIERLLNNNCIKYSEVNKNNINEHNVLIIDNIGILAHAYYYTDFAFIGGGFSNALHNVLEPACFGNIVLFGPKHQKFHEAQEMIDANCAFEIQSYSSLEASINQGLVNLNTYKNNSTNYILNKKGATQKTLSLI